MPAGSSRRQGKFAHSGHQGHGDHQRYGEGPGHCSGRRPGAEHVGLVAAPAEKVLFIYGIPSRRDDLQDPLAGGGRLHVKRLRPSVATTRVPEPLRPLEKTAGEGAGPPAVTTETANDWSAAGAAWQS